MEAEEAEEEGCWYGRVRTTTKGRITGKIYDKYDPPPPNPPSSLELVAAALLSD